MCNFCEKKCKPQIEISEKYMIKKKKKKKKKANETKNEKKIGEKMVVDGQRYYLLLNGNENPK